MKKFLNRQRNYKLKSCFRDSAFISKLVYLLNIFDQLNRLKLKLQRRDTTVLDFIDALNAFVQKLKNWQQKSEKGNFAIFDTLSSVIEGNLHINLSSEILQHLVKLRKEYLTYFPKISDVDLEPMRKDFAIPIEKVTDDLPGELIDFRNDSACKDMFETLSIYEFWANVCVSCQKIGKECIKVLLPFSITYLSETGFSTLVQIKAKAETAT